MSEQELLPCPFCGSENLDVAQTGIWWVTCQHCGAEGRTHDDDDHSFKTKERAITAWNIRTPSATNKALVEALEGTRVGGCWCGLGIGNPMITQHPPHCVAASAALATAKGGE